MTGRGAVDVESPGGHTIVRDREKWAAPLNALAVREKEHTRLGDEVALARQELPWLRVDKDYRLQTADGPKALAELFDGRSQLAIYHFMFGPSYEAGCPVNSSIADSIDGLVPHLAAHDVTFICVSGAPIEKLLEYRRRMGWHFNWASSYESDFNLEVGFSATYEQTRVWVEPARDQLPAVASRNAAAVGTDLVGYLTEGFGFTSFTLVDGVVYQTYSTTARGVEFLMGYYPIIDRVANGRLESDGFQLWIRRRDEYGPG
jgi:predicted dithiol-disulfide oxidoreductase (DUF899 family)